jgi:hypothetical protein
VAPVAGGEAIEIQTPVEVIELVLQAPCEQPGALYFDGLAGDVHAGDDRMVRAQH